MVAFYLVPFMQGCPEGGQAAFYWLQWWANYVRLQTSRSMFDGAAGTALFHSASSQLSLIVPTVCC